MFHLYSANYSAKETILSSQGIVIVVLLIIIAALVAGIVICFRKYKVYVSDTGMTIASHLTRFNFKKPKKLLKITIYSTFKRTS